MVNKRLRYEILRRDNFRCTYCGASPSEAELHIDHVIPQALGGTDAPENLTTACEPCNLGKASTGPSEEVVAAVNLAVAAEQSARLRAADYLAEFFDDLNAYEDDARSIWDFHVPDHVYPVWDINTIAEWKRLGVGTTLIDYALRVAMASSVKWPGLAAYAAAVIRNKVQEARDATHQNHQT